MVLLFAVTVLIASCSKDSETATKLGAKIGGKSWSAPVRVTTLTNGVFVITGTSATGETLIITINGDTPSVYEFNLNSLLGCNATYKKSALSSDIYTSVTGRVELTKVDKTNKKISGKFEFTLLHSLTDNLSVTGGVFNDLEYNEYSIPN